MSFVYNVCVKQNAIEYWGCLVDGMKYFEKVLVNIKYSQMDSLLISIKRIILISVSYIYVIIHMCIHK